MLLSRAFARRARLVSTRCPHARTPALTRRFVHTARDKPRWTPERIAGAVLVLVNGGGLVYFLMLRRKRQQRIDDYARLNSVNVDNKEATLDVGTAKELARVLYRQGHQWPEGGVTRHDVEQALSELGAEPRPRESVLHIFRQFDHNGQGITNGQELLLVSALFADGSVEERARLVYDVFDGNQDGRITRQELESTLDRLPIAVMYSLASKTEWGRALQVVATLFGDKSYTTPVSRSEFLQHPAVVGLLADGLAEGDLGLFFQENRDIVDLFLRAVVRAAIEKQRASG